MLLFYRSPAFLLYRFGEVACSLKLLPDFCQMQLVFTRRGIDSEERMDIGIERVL